MTSFDDTRRLRGRLREVLHRDLPTLFAPNFGLREDAIAAEAALIEQRWGVAQFDARPRPAVYDVIKAALQASGAGVEALPGRLIPLVPYAMLYGSHVGRDDKSALHAFIKRLGAAGRSASRRIWPHYLLSLERHDAATSEIGAWLKRNRSFLPPRLSEFSDKYDVFQPERATSLMAQAVLSGKQLCEDIQAAGIGIEKFHASALLAEVMCSIGNILGSNVQVTEAVQVARRLLPAGRSLALDQTQTRDPAKHRAIGSFVAGLVDWQRRVDHNDTNVAPALELVLDLNGDPRFDMVRWQDAVPASTRSTVEIWLTKHTIDAFFRVANQIRIERADMWAERRKFWLSYLPYVRRAWLIVGDSGVAFANREQIRFGRFSGGASEGHCGLLLDFGDLRVLEMNMNGRAILWQPANVLHGTFPEVYDETPFDRGRFGDFVARTEVWQNGCIGLGHRPPNGWQSKFADHIQQRTNLGIRPKGH
jgi:hypothetical protein